MLITPNWEASSGCSSTLTLPTLTSVRSSATSSTMGLSIRQGPHQVAQKSSRTGFVLCSTSASKFSLVMVTTAILVPSIFYPHPLRGRSVPSKEGVILTYGSSIPQTTGFFQKQSVNKKGGGPPAWGEPPPCVVLWSSPGCLVRTIRP